MKFVLCSIMLLLISGCIHTMFVSGMISTGQTLHSQSQIEDLESRMIQLEKKQFPEKNKPYCLSVDPNCK